MKAALRSRRRRRALALAAGCAGLWGCNLLFDIGSGTFVPPDASTAPEDATPVVVVDSAIDADAGPLECGLVKGGARPCAGGCAPPLDVKSPESDGGALTGLRSDGRAFYVAGSSLVHSLRPPSGETRVEGPRGGATTFAMGAAGEAVFVVFAGSLGRMGVRRQSRSCDAGGPPDAAAFVEAGFDAAILDGIEYICNYHEYPEIRWTRPSGEIVGTSALSAWFRSDDPTSGPQVVEFKVLGPDPTYYSSGPPGRRFALPAPGTSLDVRGSRIVYGYDGGAGTIDLGTEGREVLLSDAASVVDVAASCTHAFLAEPGRIVRAPLAPNETRRSELRFATGERFSGDMAVDRTHLWFVAGTKLYAVAHAAFDGADVLDPSAVTTIGEIPGGAEPSVAVTDDYVAVLGGTSVRIWKKF